MNSEALRTQIRDLLKMHTPATSIVASAQPAGVVIPLVLNSSGGDAILADIFRRVAASPALAMAAAAGLLRFDLRLDLTAQGAACCDSCREKLPCDCKGAEHDSSHDHSHDPAHSAHADAKSENTELKGVISERLVKSIDKAVKQVRLAQNAVLTPLGREALRQRGISIDRGTIL